MKSLITKFALVILTTITPLAFSTPAQAKPENFGQCTQILVKDFGVNPSEEAPGQLGNGPATIHFDAAGNIVKITSAQGTNFSVSVACQR